MVIAMNAYEELLKLRDDPEAFERARSRIIAEAIADLPEDRQTKAKCEQWKLDAELDKYHDPVARMNRMVEIFWQGVVKFDEALAMEEQIPESKSSKSATIIQFPRKTT